MLSDATAKIRPTAPPIAAVNAVARAAKIDRHQAAIIVTRAITQSSAALRALMPDMPEDDFAALIDRYTNTPEFAFALAEGAASASAARTPANDNDAPW
jgi:hypothetical protein